jgi:aspartate carbamoyltransferase catalytic subunit
MNINVVSSLGNWIATYNIVNLPPAYRPGTPTYNPQDSRITSMSIILVPPADLIQYQEGVTVSIYLPDKSAGVYPSHVLQTTFAYQISADYAKPNQAKILINGGDETPTQALLDAFSIREKLKSVRGKKIAIIGDILHSRVALSNIFALQKLGADVLVCGPPTLLPRHIAQLGVKVEWDLKKALAWCDVANVLRIQLERQQIKYFPSLREYAMYYGITKKLLDSLEKPIVLMHPGPINRGVELSSDAADSHHSIILDQVENGVAVRMAVMYLLAGAA